MDNLVWIVLASMLAGGIVDRVFASREWKKFYEGQDTVLEMNGAVPPARRKAPVNDRTPR